MGFYLKKRGEKTPLNPPKNQLKNPQGHKKEGIAAGRWAPLVQPVEGSGI